MMWRDGKDALPKSGKKIVIKHFNNLYIGEYFSGGRYFSCVGGDKFNPIDVEWLDEDNILTLKPDKTLIDAAKRYAKENSLCHPMGADDYERSFRDGGKWMLESITGIKYKYQNETHDKRFPKTL